VSRRRRNWALLVVAVLIGGAFLQAFIPRCGTIAATGICDPTWVYLAALIVTLIAVAAEIVLGSSDDSGRPCPSCNTQVPTGRTRCEACGYDFAAGARPDP
jgi:hypothetical protein